MKKYKLMGVSQYAKKHLTANDLTALEEMVGCNIIESENKAEIDGGKMFVMPDGEDTHIDFLDVEEIIN